MAVLQLLQGRNMLSTPFAKSSLKHVALLLLCVAPSSIADFLSNVARYGRFFVTVMLGTVSVMTRPFTNMLKNPVSGVLAIVGLVGGVVLMKITLEAMLGMSEAQDYVPGAVAGFQ